MILWRSLELKGRRERWELLDGLREVLSYFAFKIGKTLVCLNGMGKDLVIRKGAESRGHDGILRGRNGQHQSTGEGLAVTGREQMCVLLQRGGGGGVTQARECGSGAGNYKCGKFRE